MGKNWTSKAALALVTALLVSGCVVSTETGDQVVTPYDALQALMDWNPSRQAELGLNDSTGNGTAVTDRRSIFGGFFTEGFRPFSF